MEKDTVMIYQVIQNLKRQECIDDLEQIEREIIHWTKEDFYNQAFEQCDHDHGVLDKTYDADKFQYALELMIQKHDPMIGITWDTVSMFLELHCRRPNTA